MAAGVGQILFGISLATSLQSGIKNLSQLDRQVLRMGRSFEDSAQSVQSLARVMTGLTAVGATALTGMVVATALVIRSAADMEEEMLNVQKTTNLTSGKIEDLRQNFISLSEEIPIVAEQLGEIAARGGQLGITGVRDLTAFTDVVAKIGAVTDLSTERASVSMARLSNQFNLPITEAKNLGSAMNELSNKTTATVANLDEITRRFAGTARAMNITAAEALALAATLTDLGVTQEIAGTNLINLSIRMGRAVDDFGKLTKVGTKMFREIFHRDKLEAIKVFTSSFAGMDFEEVSSQLSEIGIRGGRLTQVVLALANGQDRLAKNLETSNEAFASGISLQKEFDRIVTGLNNQMRIAKNRVSALAKQVGSVLLPVAKAIVQVFGSFAQALAAIPKEMIILLAALGGIAIAMTALATVASGLAASFLTIVSVSRAMGFGIFRIGEDAAKAGKEFGTFTGLVTGKTKILTSGFKRGMKAGDGFFKSLFNGVNDFEKSFFNKGKKSTDPIKTLVEQLGKEKQAVKGLRLGEKLAIKPLPAGPKKFVGKVGDAGIDALNKATGPVTKAFDKVSVNIWAKFGDKSADAFRAGGKAVGGVFGDAAVQISNASKSVATFGDVGHVVSESLKVDIGGVGKEFRAVGISAKQTVRALGKDVGGLREGLKGLGGTLKKSGFKAFFKELGGMKGAAGASVNNVTKTLGGALSKFGGTIAKIFKLIAGPLLFLDGVLFIFANDLFFLGSLIGGVFSEFGSLIKNVVVLAFKLLKIFFLITSLMGVFMVLTNPVVLVFIALAAALFVVFKIVNPLLKFLISALDLVFNSVMGIVDIISSGFKFVMGVIWNLIQVALFPFLVILRLIIFQFKFLFTVMLIAFDVLKEIFQPVIDAAKELFDAIVGPFQGLGGGGMFKGLIKVFEFMGTVIKNVIRVGFFPLKLVFLAIAWAIKGLTVIVKIVFGLFSMLGSVVWAILSASFIPFKIMIFLIVGAFKLLVTWVKFLGKIIGAVFSVAFAPVMFVMKIIIGLFKLWVTWMKFLGKIVGAVFSVAFAPMMFVIKIIIGLFKLWVTWMKFLGGVVLDVIKFAFTPLLFIIEKIASIVGFFGNLLGFGGGGGESAADGGVAVKPTPVIAGDAGPELLAPLNSPQAQQLIGKASGGGGGGGGGGNIGKVTIKELVIPLSVEIDGMVLAEVMRRVKDIEATLTGGSPITGTGIA